MLETSEQIRKFHKKLFQQAKQEPKFMFYILYDTVYRLDILGHAPIILSELGKEPQAETAWP
jgi:RNA-directed DNA polymerase